MWPPTWDCCWEDRQAFKDDLGVQTGVAQLWSMQSLGKGAGRVCTARGDGSGWERGGPEMERQDSALPTPLLPPVPPPRKVSGLTAPPWSASCPCPQLPIPVAFWV